MFGISASSSHRGRQILTLATQGLIVALAGGVLLADHVWRIKVEEPTGIERRTEEVSCLRGEFPAGTVFPGRLRVADGQGNEVVSQLNTIEMYPDGSVRAAEVLFPVSIMPGQIGSYQLVAGTFAPAGGSAETRQARPYRTDIVIRRLGVSRLEIGNSWFGLIVSLGTESLGPAIVEAYHRRAGPQCALNLVETTPDRLIPPPLGTLAAGWGTGIKGIKAQTGFTTVEILEEGPLRARVRLTGSRTGEHHQTWEFEWGSNNPTLLWKARTEAKQGTHGFWFSGVSSTPYEPFTHWITGEEDWPQGWETDHPPHRKTAPQSLEDLPGRQVIYYRPDQNYGALAFIELDRDLEWNGIGSCQFAATKTIGQPSPAEKTGPLTPERDITPKGFWTSVLGIGFPEWKGTETVLSARSAYRRFAKPVLAIRGDATQVQGPSKLRPVAREDPVSIAEEEAGGPAEDPGQGARIELSLDGAWKLCDRAKGQGEKEALFATDADDTEWRSVKVPGSVQTQLLTYPAYFTREAEWISFREWWYRKRFPIPPQEKQRRWFLRFEATDYYADIWLNGKWIGRHEGYVDPYEFEVGDDLRIGAENVLAVRVWTPVHYYWRHRPYTVKGSYGAVDQKPDDITAVGIVRSVKLVGTGPIRITALSHKPSLNADGSADLEVWTELQGEAEEGGKLELVLAPRNFPADRRWHAQAPFDRLAGSRTVKVRLHLDKPRLWWTWDHGEPNLYTLQATVRADDEVSDRCSHAVGIREIEKVGWNFLLNRRRLFIRGTNSYYLHLFMSEMARNHYERDIGLMKEMNVNMIRLHCHFQNPEFYELCDELGILVWQDFLEAWYPRDADFARRAAELYDPLIRMVRNHPCVAIWATSDEEDLENYQVLTKHLAGRPYFEDPERRPVVRSTGRYGDGHVYFGWYGGNIWEYTKTEEQFISELGATALPNYESLVKFLPDHWPIEKHREEWVFRKLQIPEAMAAWGEPGTRTLREYIPVTQNYVAKLHRLAIERMRRRKYEAGGILHFHAVDFWPSVTMAAVDYFRVPTRSYGAVKQAFQMVLPSLEYDRDVWRIGEQVQCGVWIINDHWYAMAGCRLIWKIVGEGGRVSDQGQTDLDIPADSSRKLFDVQWRAAEAGKFRLMATVLDKQGATVSENDFEFEVR